MKKIRKNVKMSSTVPLGLLFLLLILTLLLFEKTNIDVYAQNYFYDFQNHKWLINEADSNYNILKLIFYKGVKILIAIYGIINLILFGLSFKKEKLKKHRRKFIYIVVCLAIIPLCIATLKKITNVYCPKELKIYNSDKPYVKVLEKYPDDFKQKTKGRCFPAGHASGGFALMCLYYVFEKKKNKIIGFFIGFSLGWIMGLYQMFRGMHFLSHTVITMIMSFIFIYIFKNLLLVNNKQHIT